MPDALDLPASLDRRPPKPLATPYKDLLPPLASVEREALRASIEREGVRDPILVDEEDNILDGHHRFEIKPDAPRKVIRGLSEGQKRAFVLATNFHRRNLSPEQKSELRARQIEIAKLLKEEGEAQEVIAARLGVTQQAVSLWLTHITTPCKARKPDNRVKVTKEEQAEAAERVEAGEPQAQVAADLGISQQHVSRIANSERRKRENEALKTKAPPPVTTLYGTIVIDPPWPMEKIERDVRPNQTRALDYPTMNEDELIAFRGSVPAAPDCHVFMWTTHRFLPMAIRLFDAWQFKYVCTFTWHKPGGFQPVGLPQYNSEFIVYGRHGSPKFVDTKNFFTCFAAPRREHSRKPDEFYDVIRRVTAEPRIDMFSREPRDGFAQHGNETGKFGEAAA
jgi:N6-adenosine-specific RNA methylase IME4/predicted transcriptional regulator